MDWFTPDDLPSYINKDSLPEIIRDLLLASVPFERLKDFNIPVSNLSGTFGVDGVVETPKDFIHPFIPAGKSEWEMGVDKSTKTKAEGDYKKRQGNPGTTFVFVSPQVFNKAGSWIVEKKTEKKYNWFDIKCINRDRLYEWFRSCPAVAIKWAERWGLKPENVYTLQSVWSEWSVACGKEFSKSLVIALGKSRLESQESAEEKVLSFLASTDQSLFTIESGSVDESRLFFSAVALNSDELSVQQRVPAIVCTDSATSFRTLLDSTSPLTIVTSLQDAALRNCAIQKGHRVCQVLRKASLRQVAEVVLPLRVPSDLFFDAMREHDVASERIDNLKARTGRNLSTYRAVIGGEPPKWTALTSNRSLLAALLVGGWSSEFEDDKAVMVTLSGANDYRQFTQELAPILSQDFPPLQYEKPYWRSISSYSAWPVLADALSSELLDEFSSACLEILGKRDVVRELPQEERPFAELNEIKNPYSSLLRQALAESLIQLAILIECNSAPVSFCNRKSYVNKIVLGVFERHEGQWKSIVPIIRELAEAAPDAFLDAVESALENTNSIDQLVEKKYDALLGGMEHTQLLWALELVAWDEKYLRRVIVLLLRLEQRWQHMPKNIGNRASSSIAHILSFWSPQTTANASSRNHIISTIANDYQNEFWPILISMLPKRHMMQTPNVQPKWRWDIENRQLIFEDVNSAALHIYGVCMELAKGHAQRSVELLKALSSNLDQVLREKFYVQLEQDVVGFAEHKKIVWNTLRSIITHHDEFPDSDWAFPSQEIARLKELYDRITPDDYIESHLHLFSHYPAIVNRPDGISRYGEGYTDFVEQQQRECIKTIYQDRGVKGLSLLLEACSLIFEDDNVSYPEPYLVGRLVVESLYRFLSNDELGDYIMGFVEADNLISAVLAGMFKGYVNIQGDMVLTTGYERARKKGSSFLLKYLLGASVTQELWDKVEEEDKEFRDMFWQEAFIPPWVKDEILIFGLRKMLERKRYVDALRSVQYLGESTLPFDVITQILDGVLKAPKLDEGLPVSSHSIVDLFEAARSCDDSDNVLLAGLEWQYFPYFEFSSYRAETLYEGLAESPEFFLQLVSLGYSSAKAEVTEGKSDVDENVAWRAREVLGSGASRRGWLILAFNNEAGMLDGERLISWTNQVRSLAKEQGYSRPVDAILGEQFAYSDADAIDGAWPEGSVRDLLNVEDGKNLRKGYMTGLFNRNGSYSGSSVTHYRGLKKKVEDNIKLLGYERQNLLEMMDKLAERFDVDVQYAIEREKHNDMGE